MDSKKKRAGTFSFILKVLRMQRKSRMLHLLLIAIITVSVAYNLFLPVAMKILIDSALPSKDTQSVLLIFSVFAVGYLVIVAINIYAGKLRTILSNQIASSLRLRVLNSMLRIEGQDELSENRMLTYITDDIRNVATSIPALWSTIKHVLQLFYGWILLLVFDWQLALLTTILMPLTFVIPRKFSAKLPKDADNWRNSQAKVLNTAKETRLMQNVIRVLRLHSAMLQRIKSSVKSAGSALHQYLLHQEMIGRTGFFSAELLKFIILGLGAFLVLQDHLSLGSLVGFMGLIALLNTALSSILGWQPLLLSGSDSLETILTFINEAPKREPKIIKSIAPLTKSISLKDVSFSVRDKQILRGINLEILKGKSTAFVGPSGAGKSSVLSVLLLSENGSITGDLLFDGVDLKSAYKSAYFPKVGVVFQEPRLFSGTIKENILFGNPAASTSDIEDASKRAGIYDEIISFKDGFDTYIQADSSQLSGGQKQRVAIARALIGDPELLYLDEASSALDPFTDAALKETLSSLHTNHTIVSVSHHLKEISDFDQIFVFDKGHLQESGNHKQLLEKQGLYARLWEKQNGVILDKENKTCAVKPEWLRHVPIFESLDNASLEAIAQEFVMERFDANQTIFSEDDMGSKMYIIASGLVEITAPGARPGERQLLAKFSSGDFFGEIALLFQRPRTARAQTKSVCVLLSLTSRQLKKLLSQMPKQVNKQILEIAKQRLDENPFAQKDK